MPYKDPDKKRGYQKEYMRQRRDSVRPSLQEPVKSHQEQTEGTPRFIDRGRPYAIESRYPYPAYLVQSSNWFNPQTGELVGKVR